MRSGMRSWSKCVIFSRRMKSSSSVGPRSAGLERVLVVGDRHALVGGQALAARRRRARGRAASMVAFRPGAARRAGLVRAVAFGQRARADQVATAARHVRAFAAAPRALSRPCSAALFALKGIAATVASVSAACWEGRSPVLDFGAFDAALSEARAAALPATVFLEEGRLEAAIEQLARVGEAQNYAALSEAGIIAMALIFSHAPPTSCVRSSRCT